MLRKILLACGILAALLYVGSDILAAARWQGYSYTAQSVSELRAIGAPTRSFLVPVLSVYALLEIAFSAGVWAVANQKRALQVAGGLLLALGALDLVGMFMPLNLSQTVDAQANVVHIWATVATVLLLLLTMAFGAKAGGKWFRFYTVATILVFLVTGALAFGEIPRIAANLPTPWLGVRERINIYSYMLWLAVFAVVLWRGQTTTASGKPLTRIGSPQFTPR